MAELEEILEGASVHLDKERPDLFRVEKAKFDEKIQGGKFSHVVNAREYY